MVHVDTDSFFLIVLSSAVAAITVAALPKQIAPPVVVLELLLGILIGPHGFSLASTDEFSLFFSNLGLGMLFYFAGYEINFERIHGLPLRLGSRGWLLSVAIAYAIGGVLALAGVIDSFVYTGSAMATTAIGTLIPILRDSGEMKTRFGTYLLAAGAVGEFGPILLVTLFLSTGHPLQEAVILIAFVLIAVGIALLSMGVVWRGLPALERTLEASNQLAVRVTVVLVFGLVGLAGHLHLDILLGGFVAGMITRAALRGHEVAVFDSKLTAVGFGFGSIGAMAKLHRARLLLRDRAAPGGRDHDPGGRVFPFVARAVLEGGSARAVTARA
jgi:Kef-type K+ transport system membrane component KefB